jgi:hypothetical protein
MNIDEALEARALRSEAWAEATAGRITTAQLYEILAALRARYGDAVYARRAR